MQKTNYVTKHVYYHEVFTENGVYGYKKYSDKELKDIVCGGAIYVHKVITDIDTNEQSLVLRFQNSHGLDVEYVIQRKDLTDTGILILASVGVQVDKNSARILIKSIQNQIPDAESVTTHRRLGFSEYNGQEIFKGAKGINIESKYNGDISIIPKGFYTNWKQMVDNEVIGNTALEFIIASSVAGLLVDYLKKIVPIENIIIHCVGESSSGKSTSALLAVSTGSAPDLAGDSFAFNFQDTQNSLMRSIPSSYPTLIDEGSLLDAKDLTNMMYSISSGVEKKRLSKDLRVQENVKFNTVIYLTSEKSLLKQCKQNSGLLVRHIEIQGEQWTKSAEQSDIIKSTISENYGHLLPLVAEEILQIGKEELVEELKEITVKIVNRTKKNNTYNEFTERISKQLALIVLSAYILKRKLEFDLNINKIADFMLKAIAENQETMGDRALNWISSWITKNYNNLIVGGDIECTGTCKGRINTVDKISIEEDIYAKKQLLIDKESFIDMLNEGGFDNPDIVLKELRSRGYLESPKDRYVSNISIVDATHTKGYKIYIPIYVNENKVQEENLELDTKKIANDVNPKRVIRNGICLRRDQVKELEEKEARHKLGNYTPEEIARKERISAMQKRSVERLEKLRSEEEAYFGGINDEQ